MLGTKRCKATTHGGGAGSKLRGEYFLGISLAFASLFFSTDARGTEIDLFTLLANPSFEASPATQAPTMGATVGCPTAWTCVTSSTPFPGFTVYSPTSADFTPGHDNLSGSMITPTGVDDVAIGPIIEGSGAMFESSDPDAGALQDMSLGQYVDGVTYVLDIWVGTPKVDEFDNIPAGQLSLAEVYFLGDNLANLSGGATDDSNAAVQLSVPSTPGMWELDQVTFTPEGTEGGQNIGVELYVNTTPPAGGSGNDDVANFDITSANLPPPPATPEPGTFVLIGAGLIGMGWVTRRKFPRNRR